MGTGQKFTRTDRSEEKLLVTTMTTEVAGSSWKLLRAAGLRKGKGNVQIQRTAPLRTAYLLRNGMLCLMRSVQFDVNIQ